MTPTPLHRKAYEVIVARPQGVTRHQLVCGIFPDAAQLDPNSKEYETFDRRARGLLEEVRTLAATHPHSELGPLVIGFDPAERVYTYAKSVEQADRIMASQESRIKSIASAWRAQQKAAEHLGRRAPPVVQDALLTIERPKNWRGA